MFDLAFVIKGIDRDGREVRVSDQQFTTLQRAEIATLDFYGDPRFKRVWAAPTGEARRAA